MTCEYPEWNYWISHMALITVFTLILHPDGHRVLLVPDGSGWTLPYFTRVQWELWSCTGDVNTAMQRQFGITPVTLRCHDLGATEAGDWWLVYGVECAYTTNIPLGNGRWAVFEEIVHEGMLPSYLSACLRNWIAWEAQPTDRRVPWYRRGWAPSAVVWMTAQVQALGLGITAPPQQRRSCQRSTIWEISTAEGPLFFKAVPSFFRHEIAITQYLAQCFPDAVPHILAADEQCGWMIMDNAGDHTLDRSSSLETWCSVINRYAEMQVAMSHHCDRLAALGCPALSPTNYGNVLGELLMDEEALTPVNPRCALTVDERSALRKHRQHIATVAQHLANAVIPLTLEHGDFWSAQVLLNQNTPVIIDWSDVSITMPFFSLFKELIPHEMRMVFPESPDAEDHIREAYLEPWTPFASRDQLHDLYEQARAVAALHYAAFSYRYLMPQMEVRWEHCNMIPYYLKQLCQAYGTGYAIRDQATSR